MPIAKCSNHEKFRPVFRQVKLVRSRHPLEKRLASLERRFEKTPEKARIAGIGGIIMKAKEEYEHRINNTYSILDEFSQPMHLGRKRSKTKGANPRGRSGKARRYTELEILHYRLGRLHSKRYTLCGE